MKKIRVLVVDDSALMRKMIPQILNADHDIEVVGTAIDGIFALKKIPEVRPDVITLDIDMPKMDGIATLHSIMQHFAIPTIMVSSLSHHDADMTLKALGMGAFDFVTKPHDAISLHISDIGGDLIRKIKAAHDNPLSRLKIKKNQSVIGKQEKKTREAGKQPEKIIAIGISTGGPNALSYLLPQLPGNFPAGILIVQHMPKGFTGMLANRLNAACQIAVKEACEGDLVLAGRALVAPGDRHLKIKRMPLGTIAVLSTAPPVSGHRPSVDVLFRSVAEEYAGKATGLIMTGMGNDGALGLGEIQQMGGLTVAQDEDSCIVFGMPKAAVERRVVAKTVSLENMAEFLINEFCIREESYGTVTG